MPGTTAPLTERANVRSAQVGNGKTPHYIAGTGFQLKTLCSRAVSRELSDRDAAKMGDHCKACTKAAEEIAAANEATPTIHEHVSSLGAYTAVVCADASRDCKPIPGCPDRLDVEIAIPEDGDVMVVEAEGVVGIVIDGRPYAITTARGDCFGESVFPALEEPVRETAGGRYATAADVAETIARRYGFPVEERHASTPADETPAIPQPEEERYSVHYETRRLFPGYDEDRISVNRHGHADALLYVALPHEAGRNVRSTLAALGWRLVGDLGYIAGINLERGRVERTEPADTPEAAELRTAVVREVVARMTAHTAYSQAAHFRPAFSAGGTGRYPIGWTFRTGYGEAVRFGWVTALGRLIDRVGCPTREEAGCAVQQRHAGGEDAPADKRPMDIVAAATTGDLGTLSTGLRQADPAARLVRSLAPMKSRQLAGNRCVHNLYAREGDRTDPVAACARKHSSVSVGVFSDEGCVDAFDCAVQASDEAARLNAEEIADGREPLCRWALMCEEHEEQPADGREECATGDEDEEGDGQDDGDDEGPAPAAPAAFAEGDRIVCADGVTRTVAHMAPAVHGEPDRVVVEDRTEWIADNCLRGTPAPDRSTRSAGESVAEHADTPEDGSVLAQLAAGWDRRAARLRGWATRLHPRSAVARSMQAQAVTFARCAEDLRNTLDGGALPAWLSAEVAADEAAPGTASRA
ncbi:hypothetical protein PH213_20465 [Streptomyces sp. SRF1]|uniref:hypothetical protein n=1 Tax=Streptomyces sp. SRF1 TaxID=1549642 RepID=UPI0025B01C0E|nr:hypothetical protein [Streptomyces sp. SRF1]MDN3056881.1 hypothetical protein [Streptomyces sp. SRF1]